MPKPRKHQAAPRDLSGVAVAHAETHVVKRLRPSQPGAKKLTLRCGDALVCVRYRHDPTGTLRYTTVELIVDHAPVASRVSPDEPVLVHIDFDNAKLQRQARARRQLGRTAAPLAHDASPCANAPARRKNREERATDEPA